MPLGPGAVHKKFIKLFSRKLLTNGKKYGIIYTQGKERLDTYYGKENLL